MRRLHINAGELTAKAHERGFDSLDMVESAILYPNGTIYFHGSEAASDGARHQEILSWLSTRASMMQEATTKKGPATDRTTTIRHRRPAKAPAPLLAGAFAIFRSSAPVATGRMIGDVNDVAQSGPWAARL